MKRGDEDGARLERGADKSVQAAVVQALRTQIQASPTGAYLGSEAEILRRLGVSSPTLRQAARLLEQQQLLSVARGKGGGYFGRRPDGGATTRAAALYLESVGTPISQVRSASLPLLIEAVRLAARSTNADRRASFGAASRRWRRWSQSSMCAWCWRTTASWLAKSSGWRRTRRSRFS